MNLRRIDAPTRRDEEIGPDRFSHTYDPPYDVALCGHRRTRALVPVGAETVLASREIERPWVEDDDLRAAATAAAEARATELRASFSSHQRST